MRILILANNDIGLYKFRKELVEALLALNHEVFISLPKGKFVNNLVEMGCHYVETEISRHGVNPFVDFMLFMKYRSMLKKIMPDIVFTYTIKPNIYGGMACQVCKIPYLANITGLGMAIQNGGVLQKISLLLYRLGLKGAKRVFFQNSENHRFMVEKGVVKTPTTIVPGSGVNLDDYPYADYPSEENGIHFLFVGRIMKDKGIDELLAAAKEIKCKCTNLEVEFDVIGGYDGRYESILEKAQGEGIIKYHGEQKDVKAFYRACHCVVLPSYHEGMANVLLEGAATGRPLIASNIPGCREAVDDGVNGFLCDARDSISLFNAMLKIIKMCQDSRKTMGEQSRKMVERHFDRQIIVKEYIKNLV